MPIHSSERVYTIRTQVKPKSPKPEPSSVTILGNSELERLRTLASSPPSISSSSDPNSTFGVGLER